MCSALSALTGGSSPPNRSTRGSCRAGAAPRRRLVAPQLVDEGLLRDGVAATQQQRQQQPARPAPAYLDRPPVAAYLQRAEHEEVHPAAPPRQVPDSDGAKLPLV